VLFKSNSIADSMSSGVDVARVWLNHGYAILLMIAAMVPMRPIATSTRNVISKTEFATGKMKWTQIRSGKWQRPKTAFMARQEVRTAFLLISVVWEKGSVDSQNSAWRTDGRGDYGICKHFCFSKCNFSFCYLQDHTLGLSTGHYAHLNMFELEGHIARLNSPIFRTNGKCEFRIFTHLLGHGSGSLNIYTRTATEETKVFSRPDGIGDFWEKVTIKINGTGLLRVIVEGVAGGVYGNEDVDLAIDDTSFSEGCVLQNKDVTLPTLTTTKMTTTKAACEPHQFECESSNQCIPDYKVCDFKKDCDDGSDETLCGTCDFESSTCGWVDRSYESVVWSRQTGPSASPSGPQVDQTYGNSSGSYMTTVVDIDQGSFSETAILIGPTFGKTSQTCRMSLWVYANSPNVFTMRFFFSNASNIDEDFNFIDELNDVDSGYWKRFFLTIGEYPAGFLVEILTDFVVYNADDEASHVSIDDVEFLNCGSDQYPVNETLDCTFDDDKCYYYDDATSGTYWLRGDTTVAVGSTLRPLYDRKISNFAHQILVRKYVIVIELLLLHKTYSKNFSMRIQYLTFLSNLSMSKWF
jgi:hypothetical protein